MSLSHELFGIICLAIIFAMVFLLGEFLRRVVKVSPEVSRKTVHIGGCLVALIFPVMLKSHWSVLVMAATATTVIIFGKRKGMLPSLDDVSRITRGSVFHPIAIYLCFLTAQLLQRMVYYEIALLVLGFSDSMAALTGVTYGRKKYLVEATDSKSLEGSTIFFVITFIIVEIGLLLFTPISRLDCILVALLIAICVTLFEAISMHGADNLAVPLGTIFILAKNTNPITAIVLYQFLMLAFALVYVNAVAFPFKKVSPTGVISMVLAIYTAGGLVNYRWMLPLAVAVFVFCRTKWFISESTEPNRARPAFYLLVVPSFWILSANLLGKNISEHERYLQRKIQDGVKEIDGLSIVGPEDPDKRGGVFSFNIKGLRSHDISMMLDIMDSIMIRSGMHCAHPFFVSRGIDGCARASVYLYNDDSDIDRFITALKKLSSTFSE